MADLALETARLDERQRATRREAEELRERTRKGIARLAQLKRALGELERGEESHRGPMQTWNEYMQVMIQKDRQYTQQLVNYKASYLGSFLLFFWLSLSLLRMYVYRLSLFCFYCSSSRTIFSRRVSMPAVAALLVGGVALAMLSPHSSF